MMWRRNPEKEFKKTMKRTLAAQQAKVDTYHALRARGLPVPADLKAEVEDHGTEVGFR